MDLEALLRQRPIILQLLRFIAIGVLNTAIDFIILNIISKTLGISSGLQLGTINVVGFIAAMIQSYFWNRSWAFAGAEQALSVVSNFFRLVVVGGLGAVGLLAVLAGAKIEAAPIFYLIVLALFLVAEVIIWLAFGLDRSSRPFVGKEFATFAVVSAVGLLINSGIVAFVSPYLVTGAFLGLNADLAKNLAKVVATAVSLIWNFIGYKLIAFRA